MRLERWLQRAPADMCALRDMHADMAQMQVQLLTMCRPSSNSQWLEEQADADLLAGFMRSAEAASKAQACDMQPPAVQPCPRTALLTSRPAAAAP